MGAFINVLAVRGCMEEQIREVIEKEAGRLDLIPEECQYKTCSGGVEVLLNDGCTGYDDIPKVLSKKLRCPVMLCYIYDGDYWGYFLYDNGKEADYFNPVPDYFGDVPSYKAHEFSGNSSIIAKYFDVDEDKIKNYLVLWEDKALESGERQKAYEDDEFCIGDDWQMADFMGKIGFPYD